MSHSHHGFAAPPRGGGARAGGLHRGTAKFRIFYPKAIASSTYDHRTLKTRLPVRSALFKQRTGGLVVRWVTTSEYPLLYVFGFFVPLTPSNYILLVQSAPRKRKVFLSNVLPTDGVTMQATQLLSAKLFDGSLGRQALEWRSCCAGMTGRGG